MSASLPRSLAGRDFLSTSDLSVSELEALLELAFELKNEQRPYRLDGKSIVLLFFNSSLRTRTSFEIAAYQLGAHHVTLNVGADAWELEERTAAIMDGSKAEHVIDAARTLSRYADAIAVRAYPAFRDYERDQEDSVVEAFRRYASVPVINMESARAHPLQALGDLMTLRETFATQGDGTLKGRKVTLTWAPHVRPLPHSLGLSLVRLLARFGCEFTVAHPEQFALDESVVAEARELARAAGGSVRTTTDRASAFEGAEVVYARSWCARAFYGAWDDERQYVKRLPDSWTVTASDMARTAGGRGRFMHALPVRRNLVATDAVVDAPSAIVYQQAENRLHAQKALLLALLQQ